MKLKLDNKSPNTHRRTKTRISESVLLVDIFCDRDIEIDTYAHLSRFRAFARWLKKITHVHTDGTVLLVTVTG